MTGAHLIGRVLGNRFELYRVIGDGTFGWIYLARDRAADHAEPVSVKLLKRCWRDDLEVLQRFRLEASALERVRSDNVVKFVARGEAPGIGPYYVAEYSALGSLDERLGLESFAPGYETEALVLWAGIVEGAADLHTIGTAHRDIKPGNVLMCVAPHAGLVPKLCDLGIALHSDARMTGFGRCLGSKAYMAPEQARGLSDQVGPPSDVFALAVLLHELVTGSYAIDEIFFHELVEKTTPERIHALIADAWPEHPQVAAVLGKCLARAPRDRYVDANELLAAFRDAWSRDEEHALESLSDRTERKPPSRDELDPTLELTLSDATEPNVEPTLSMTVTDAVEPGTPTAPLSAPPSFGDRTELRGAAGASGTPPATRRETETCDPVAGPGRSPPPTGRPKRSRRALLAFGMPLLAAGAGVALFAGSEDPFCSREETRCKALSCTDLSTDVRNCGTCGHACGSQHGQARCEHGTCRVACSRGFGDCNANPDDGCEIDLLRNPAHCGNCGFVCRSGNANPGCRNGVCGIHECAAGFADCNQQSSDGCEAALGSDAQNCGACRERCPAGPCVGGRCRVRILASGQLSPSWVTIEQEHACWLAQATNASTSDVVCAGLSADDSLGVAPIARGIPAAWRIALAGGRVVWSSALAGAGTVFSRSLSLTPAEPIARGLVYPTEIAPTQGGVAWIIFHSAEEAVPGGQLMVFDFATGAMRRVAAGLKAPQALSVRDGLAISATCGQNPMLVGVRLLDAEPSQPKELARLKSCPTASAASRLAVYAIVGSDIVEIDRSGSVVRTVAAAEANPVGIAADDVAVYWTNQGESERTGSVRWSKHDEREPHTLAENQPFAMGIAVDARHVVWSTHHPEGRIIMFDKDR